MSIIAGGHCYKCGTFVPAGEICFLCGADTTRPSLPSEIAATEGPEHLCPKPADGLKFDASGVLVPASPAATPRTDALIDKYVGDDSYKWAVMYVTLVAHARTLERECADLRTEAEALKGRLADARRTSEYWKAEHNAANEAAESALAAARASERELRIALRKIEARAFSDAPAEEPEDMQRDLRLIYDYARSALGEEAK